MFKLGQRLSRMWGRVPSDAEVGHWLLAQGFINSGKTWYCDGEKVDCLQEDEILNQVWLDTYDGVTFVDPPSQRGGANAG